MEPCLDRRDTDYVRENLVFNYLLGDEPELLIRSYIHNNGIDIHFCPECFYFFMTGMNKRFFAPHTPETFACGVRNTHLLYDRMRSEMLQCGYDGDAFQIKTDNSKQIGVLFSAVGANRISPEDLAKKMFEIYKEVQPQQEYVSTSLAGPYSGYDQIHKAFLDARALNDLRFFGLRDCVITQSLKQAASKPCDITAILANVRSLIHIVCCGTKKQALLRAGYIIDQLVAPSYSMLNYCALQVAVDDLLIMLETVYPDCLHFEHPDAEHFVFLLEYRAYLLATLETIFEQLQGTRRYPPVILLALSYIHRNYAHPLSLSQLSEYAYTNPSTLSSEFNAAVGVSLSEYIAGLRLQHAKQLLCETHKGVEDVAHLSGFTSAKYFREVFKRQTGLSPQQYREKMRKEQTKSHQNDPGKQPLTEENDE